MDMISQTLFGFSFELSGGDDEMPLHTLSPIQLIFHALWLPCWVSTADTILSGLLILETAGSPDVDDL